MKDDDNRNYIPLAKSESASVIKQKSCEEKSKETPKTERKSWTCPKCNLENDYWRIICYVCSNIKPYFDFDLTPSGSKTSLKFEEPVKKKENMYANEETAKKMEKPMLNLERSKTQIGFSALARLVWVY